MATIAIYMNVDDGEINKHGYNLQTTHFDPNPHKRYSFKFKLFWRWHCFVGVSFIMFRFDRFNGSDGLCAPFFYLSLHLVGRCAAAAAERSLWNFKHVKSTTNRPTVQPNLSTSRITPLQIKSVFMIDE